MGASFLWTSLQPHLIRHLGFHILSGELDVLVNLSYRKPTPIELKL